MAWSLLRAGYVHVLATDAHNLTRRPPRMAQARDLIAKRQGQGVADLLCTGNPLAIYEGKPLPSQAPLEALRDQASAAERPFWKRLFGRD
jgi:protein-tyrosine phosphatase